MLIFILIDVQYSQKAVCSFEKGSNCQNHSFSGSHYPVKKLPPQGNFWPPTTWRVGGGVNCPPLNAIWKTLDDINQNILNILFFCILKSAKKIFWKTLFIKNSTPRRQLPKLQLLNFLAKFLTERKYL